jgi:hypothetical protein
MRGGNPAPLSKFAPAYAGAFLSFMIDFSDGFFFFGGQRKCELLAVGDPTFFDSCHAAKRAGLSNDICG